MEYDITIVGAGPSGSTLARLLAGHGLRILLLNGSGSREKPCGGLLAPDAQKALAGFDLTLPKHVLVDPQIFSVKTIDIETGLVRYYQRAYLNMSRLAFDNWLISLVPESVNILNARCAGVRREEGGYSLDLRLPGGESRPVRTAVVVGADRANSIVRRSFFRTDILSYVAIQQWFLAGRNANPFYSCIFDQKTSESCSWSICKDDYFVYGGAFAKKDCRAMFEAQKQRLQGRFGFSFGEPVRTEACLVYRPRRFHDFVTGQAGAYLVGEAAGFISPSSFEGLSSAIRSAEALCDAILGGSGDAKAVSRRYRRSMLPLKAKLSLKWYKRLFMYNPFLRHVVMSLGLNSIPVRKSENEADG